MPQHPRFVERAVQLELLGSRLRGALLASNERLDAEVAAMTGAEVEQAYAELDALRSRVHEAIERVMVRRRVVAAADAIERELSTTTDPDEREKLRAQIAEHAELVASLR
jgi:uncharacterized membrane protein